MKLSPILCAPIVALAALAMSAAGALAAPLTTSEGYPHPPAKALTAPNSGAKPCFYLKDGKPSGTVEPCKAGQSTAVSSSRSNIKNN